MTAIKKQKRLLDSYLSLRRLIGALGFLLPVVVLIWGCALNGSMEDTISD